MPSLRLSERYANAVLRRRRWILVASFLIAVGAGWSSESLPVHTDFSSLLPPSAPSVVDLKKLEKRARVISTAMFMVESDDPEKREAAARAAFERAKQLPTELVSKVTYDERDNIDFIWNHRWLFASLEDLEHARDRLKEELRHAKLASNPLYIDLDDGPRVIHSTDDALARLLADARAKHEGNGELVSKDGRCQMVLLSIAFPAGDGARAARLLAEMERILADVRAGLPPGVEIGISGDVVVDRAEHAAILDGMVLAIVATTTLVFLVLFLFFRSPFVVGAQMWALAVGTAVTFALTRLIIGELNIATAFLSSIVVGNGMNFGIVVAARYVEEIRNGTPIDDRLARTLRHTFTGTLAAAATAAVAYGALVVTDFRGFRHFGVIGGLGMLACWIAAFTVLPAALASMDRRGWLRARRPPAIGRLLARLVPRRSALVATAMLAVVGAAGFETWRYFTEQPFENNFRNLRSDSAAVREEARWVKLNNKAYGRGVASGFVMAVDDRAQVAPLVTKLRKLDEGKQPKQRLFARLTSLDDVLPADQPAKLAVLDQIRALLTPQALEQLPAAQRAQIEELRPPPDLRPVTEDDLPASMKANFTEADGTRGRLIFALAGFGYDVWNSNHILQFARKVRDLDLGPHVVIGAQAFVFADVLGTIERDGVRATMVALVGAVLVVFVVLGVSRAAIVTLVCGVAGTLLMLAVGSLCGLKVNFLDFVALPITIGIGIDYSVNIVAREREEGDARKALGTVGGAVVLCSSTTIIGYGSLILSQNLAIRSFGLAAILGEITCLGVALALAPALSAVLLRIGQQTVDVTDTLTTTGRDPTDSTS